MVFKQFFSLQNTLTSRVATVVLIILSCENPTKAQHNNPTSSRAQELGFDVDPFMFYE